MMNMLELQDKLKNFSEEQLVSQMQSPTGDTPQFLVLGEIERRQRMKAEATRQQGTNQPTVAQDVVNAAGVPQGGIADMAQAMAPQTDMTQNTGIMSAAPTAEPQRMAAGGVVKMAVGRQVTSGPAFNDPETIRRANQAGKSVARYLNDLPPERAAAIQADAARRAANKTMSLGNVFDPRLSAFDQTSSGDLIATSEAMTDDLAAASANPGRSLGAGAQYDRGMPDMLTAEQVYDLDNPAAVPELSTTGRTLADFMPPVDQRMSTLLNAPKDRDRQIFAPPADINTYGGEELLVAPTGPAGFKPPVLTPEQQAVADERNKFYGGIGDYLSGVYSKGAALANKINAVGEDALADVSRLIPGAEQYTLDARERSDEYTAAAEQNLRDAEAAFAPDTVDVPELQNPAIRTALQNAPVAAPAPAPAPAPTDTTPTDTTPAATTPAADPTAPVADPSGGIGGISGAASSYEQALMDTLKSREQAKNQDKWLALAQVGLSMMNSQSPDFLGAAGEAGLAGVAAYKQGRDQYDADRLKILGELEDYKMKRAALAARGSGSGSRDKIPAAAATIYDNDIADLQAKIQFAETEGEKVRLTNELKRLSGLQANLRARYIAQYDPELASAMVSSGGAGAQAPVPNVADATAGGGTWWNFFD